MSRFLLVELEPDLAEHQTTRESVFRAISMTSGVRQVIDLSVISQTTLDHILLAEPVAVQRRRRRPAPISSSDL
jgi:hypothetical protein